MKTLLYTLLFFLIIGCKIPNHRANQNHKEKRNNSEIYTDYNFKIDYPGKLNKITSEGNENTIFAYQSGANSIFYSIAIETHEQDIDPELFFKEYEKNLKSNNIKFTKQKFHGFNSYEYESKQPPTKGKQLIVFWNNCSYTLTVNGNQDFVDNEFEKFKNSFGFIHTSPTYGYSILIPEGFTPSTKNGINTDLKVIDKIGNSLVIVIKELPNISFNDVAGLLTADLEKQSPFKMSKLERTKVLIDNQESVFIKYINEVDNIQLTQINYSIPYKNKLFSITISVRSNVFDEYYPMLEKSMESFKLD